MTERLASWSKTLNRYLINSTMLPQLKKNADGGITLYLQHKRIIKGRPHKEGGSRCGVASVPLRCEGLRSAAAALGRKEEPNCIPGMTKSTTKWSLATRGNLQGANVSFPRHGEIYRNAGKLKAGQAFAYPSPQPFNEFPVGYSLAGCSPAEPASASPTACHFAVNGPGPSILGRARVQCTSNKGARCRATTCCHPAREKGLLLWLLKNSLAERALENRRARMPYKRLSPARYTFLATNFESIFRNYRRFQHPLLTSLCMGPFPWEGDVGGQEMASPQRRTSR